MTSIHPIIRTTLWLFTFLLMVQCQDFLDSFEINNDEDDNYDSYFGNQTLEGVILFEDARTGIRDTAKGASVRLKLQNEPTKLIAREDVSQIATNGRFEFKRLPEASSDNYVLDISYQNQNINYSNSAFEAIETDIFNTVVLEINDTDQQLASVAGRILFPNVFTDLNQAAADARIVLTYLCQSCPSDNTQNDNCQASALAQEYIAVADPLGNFRISGLPAGCYKAKITYQQQNEGYPAIAYNVNKTHIAIAKNQAQTLDTTLQLDVSQLLNYAMKVVVLRGEDGPRQSSAEVYIYRSQENRDNDEPPGILSIASGTTNHRGVAFFTDLEVAGDYYVKTSVVIDDSLYSEEATIEIDQDNKLATGTVTIKY